MKLGRRPLMSRSVLCALVSLWTLGSCRYAANAEPTPNPFDFAPRGFLLETVIGGGWQRHESNSDGVVVFWASDDSKGDDIRAFVRIETVYSKEARAEDTAKKLAQTAKAEMSSDRVELDGETAFKLVRPNDSDKLRSTIIIVCQRGDVTYLITGGRVGDHNCDTFVAAIVKGWKWRKLSLPSECLAFHPESRTCIGDRFLINYPLTMTRKVVEDPEISFQLGLYNLKRDLTDIVVTGGLVKFRDAPDFGKNEENRDEYLRRLGQQYAVDAPLKWSASRADPPRWISNTAHSTESSKKAKVEVYLKWGLVPLSEKEAILIQCFILPVNAEDLAKYEKAVNETLDSIRPAAQQAPQR